MPDVPTLWTVEYGESEVSLILVECPNGTEYPAKDARGETIYENSHWETWDECVEALASEAGARVSVVGSQVRDAKRRLRAAEKDAGNAAAFFDHVRHMQRFECAGTGKTVDGYECSCFRCRGETVWVDGVQRRSDVAPSPEGGADA